MEHLGTGDGGLGALVLQADDLNLVADLDTATLDTAGNDGAAAGNGEDVLNGHQERLIRLAVRGRDPAVDSVHEFLDAGILGGVGIGGLADEGVQSAAADDRGVIAGEAVEVKQLTDFHLDELKQLLIVDLVALVQEHQDGRNVNLTGKQKVLTGLGHRAVGGSDNKDCAVHLGSTGDHVLDIVGVARAVDVCIVTLLGLILDVSGVDGDTTLSLFRSLIDGRVVGVLGLAL